MYTIVGLISGILVVGCAAGNGNITPSGTGGTPSAQHPATQHAGTQHPGTLHGQVLRPPGRDPRSGGGSATPVPVNGDSIEIRDGSGTVVATAVTGQDGAFRMTLAPGDYRVVEGICAAGEQVRITSDTTTRVVLTLPHNC